MSATVFVLFRSHRRLLENNGRQVEYPLTQNLHLDAETGGTVVCGRVRHELARYKNRY